MKRLAVFAAVILGAVVARADGIPKAFATESFTVTTATQSLTTTYIQHKTMSTGQKVPNLNLQALLSLETADMRYCLDGSSPTTTTCHKMTAGEELIVTGYDDLRNLKFMRDGGSNALLNVTYFE